MKVILPILYAPSVSYLAYFLKSDEVYFDCTETYPKQTFRNRAEILGANGKLTLSIPISRESHLKYNEVQFSIDENWQINHIKSIQSAYKSSPYFEFYEDELIKLYKTKNTNLMDFNWSLMNFMLAEMQIDRIGKRIYDKGNLPIEVLNLTQKFNKKNQIEINSNPYGQVFQEKFGFTPNLSGLDLLFSEGPNSANFINKLKIHNNEKISI